MTTFEKMPSGTTYDDRDRRNDRDSHQQDDGHRQHDSGQRSEGLAASENVMLAWTVALYDYAEQVLKAQRQFAESMWATAAPMFHVAPEITSPGTQEDRSANKHLHARSDKRRDGSNRSEHERYNDEDTAEYDERSADNDGSDNTTSDTSGTERGAKIDRHADVVKGKVKEATGRVLDDQVLVAEGKGDQAKGHAHR